MQNALKDIFGPMFEAMLQGEMNSHLGYESNDHGAKSTDNRRNGYTNKKIKTSSGEVDIKVLVTEIQALNLSLYQSVKKMYLKLKKRCLLCMQEE